MTKRIIGPILAIALSAAGTVSLPAPVAAQSYADYCHDRAQRLSGYRGRPGGAVEGAFRGAVGGAIITGMLGGNKKDRKRAARAGAVLGGLAGAKRPNSRAARIYRLEFQACMRRR